MVLKGFNTFLKQWPAGVHIYQLINKGFAISYLIGVNSVFKAFLYTFHRMEFKSNDNFLQIVHTINKFDNARFKIADHFSCTVGGGTMPHILRYTTICP